MKFEIYTSKALCEPFKASLLYYSKKSVDMGFRVFLFYSRTWIRHTPSGSGKKHVLSVNTF